MEKEVREIKAKMEHWGMQKKWLADQLNVSRALVTYWLSGTKDMPENYVEKVQELLKEIPEPK